MDRYREQNNKGHNRTDSDSPSTLIATATSIKFSRDLQRDHRYQQFIAMLVPHLMVESSLQRSVYERHNVTNKATAALQQNQKQEEPQSLPSKASKCREGTRSWECIWLEHADRSRLSMDLLPRIHPIFKASESGTCGSSRNMSNRSSVIAPGKEQLVQSSIMIRAIFSRAGFAQHSPADVVLLDMAPRRSDASCPFLTPTELLEATAGEAIVEEPDAILKLLIVSQVHIASAPVSLQTSIESSLQIPPCPVCLHRIDPTRLGLPKPRNEQLCSKFCSESKNSGRTPVVAAISAGRKTITGTRTVGCSKQRFLRPWAKPSNCVACHIIHEYQMVGAATRISNSSFCHQCALQTTLWVCLICGFCGCGRYSNKHAEAHFIETGHSYSLELATLRIWDYANGGEFAHRGDLLDCPAGRRQRARALQIQQQVMLEAWSNYGGGGNLIMAPSAGELDMLGAAAALATSAPSMTVSDIADRCDEEPSFLLLNDVGCGCVGGDEKSPKKACMVGKEYEALLQSALEDQAQHYQGEMSRLRAAMTVDQVDCGSLTKAETAAIGKLQSQISDLNCQMDFVSRDLVNAQEREVSHRGDSQRLLRKQRVAQELLNIIQEESKREKEHEKKQIEDLEQQISDLAANLRMRHQFSQDQELSNAHIFGTTTSSEGITKTSSSIKGKLRRFFRK